MKALVLQKEMEGLGRGGKRDERRGKLNCDISVQFSSLQFASTMSAVVYWVDNFAAELKRSQLNDVVGHATDRRRPWNKCVNKAPMHRKKTLNVQM